jgi:hypothetical protein
VRPDAVARRNGLPASGGERGVDQNGPKPKCRRWLTS